MHKRTNVLSILLITALLLALAGCDEQGPGNKTETVAPAVQVKEITPDYDTNLWEPVAASAAQSKELTPEDKLAQLQKGAEAGNAEAQYKLGVAYKTGEGVADFDYEGARKAGATDENISAYLEKEHPGIVDSSKALEWFQKSAAQGHVKAQFKLGLMYANGDGVIKDAAKAVEWYQKAAAQGDAFAQVSLGSMYRYGEGVSKNDAKAAEWYQKAAAQGNARAQTSLGYMYRDGKGVPGNLAKAVEWWQKAAAYGNADAQASLGSMYDFGLGVPKDAAKAVEWYQKAAAQGDAFAQVSLGSMYRYGEGVSKNDAKAAEWYQKAAAQGNARAQTSLGYMYHDGEGVSRDFVRSYAWLNLAAVQGYPDAKKNRDRVEARLTPAQRAEGQRLASNWKKGDTLQASNDSQPGQTSVGGTPSKQITGTAFAVSRDGRALTNHHVISGCTEVKVAGREGIAKVITSDSVNDLALLQLPGKIKDIATLNPDPAKLRQGEDIIVFGYPLNAVLSSGGNLTPGTISALTGLGNNTNQIQITAAIQPGSSGSPVLDKKGNVVGVVSMKLDDGKAARATGSIPQNVNFAVNGQTVKAFLDANKVQYKTGGGFFSREKSNADIAEEASKWTVIVECWK